MRTLYMFNMVSLDGYFEAPGRDISWHTVDEEFDEFAVEQLCTTDQLLFGRVTHDLMASYWPSYEPSPRASEHDKHVARLMNSIPKLVASRTVTSSPWGGTRVVGDGIAEELRRIKQEPGESIALFGSANLAATLMRHGLIDEYRIMVSPVLLGGGTPLFASGVRRSLVLMRTRTFSNGNVLHCYRNAP